MPKAMVVLARVEVRIPQVPDYLHLTASGKDVALDVADFDAADLRTISKEWGEALVEHAIQRRRQREAELKAPKTRQYIKI